MNIIQAILMGIIQGLSEFLPISSSAHIVFTSNIYKIFNNVDITQTSNEEIFFDIMVHLGTLIAVLIYFRHDIIKILKGMYDAIKTKNWDNNDAKLGVYIIAGTILTIITALPIKDFAERLVYSPSKVGILLFITGFALLYSEYKSKENKAKKPINIKNSVLIGIAQGLAALPGFSRSGWTIATGLFTGLDRITAARFSFLLSIPIILGTSMVYPLLKIDISELSQYNWQAIFAGTLVSAIVGYVCIKYFMKFISKFSLAIFGYYCLICGIITAIFFYFYK